MEKWQAKLNMQASGTAEAIQALAGALDLLPLTAALLYARGITTPDAAKAFLSRDEGFCNPFLLPDMEKAARRLTEAIEKREKIVIYGDYDVDGVTSVALLTQYLQAKGLTPSHYIPDRAEEGYGMSCEVLDRLAAEGHTLVVTVDTGITALEEAAHCQSIGLDLIVTDHHECREALPDAIAVVDPRRSDSRYPCPYLAGVGVAFKLATACELLTAGQAGTQHEKIDLPPVCEELIDLAALGTVADVMQLVGENRQIVRLGLERMRAHPRPAIAALLKEAAAEKGGSPAQPTAATIGYTLAPRINAAGRMAHAERALELFLAPLGLESAHAKALCELNRRRQAEENHLIERAEKQLALRSTDEPAIILWGDDFNGGIIGIVAARLAERHQKPTILISFDGDVGKGSGRSAAGIDLVGLLEGCSDLLTKYGGHTQAAGLTVDRGALPAFYERFMKLAKDASTDELPPLLYDIDVLPSQFTLRQAEELALFEPYGAGNPQPLFCWRGATVEQVQAMGEKHTRLHCSGDRLSHQVLIFGQPRQALDLFESDRIDLLVELSLNHFRGTTSIQLICRGWRMSEPVLSEKQLTYCRSLLPPKKLPTDREAVWASELTPADIPDRADCAALYSYLRKLWGYDRQAFSSLSRLCRATEARMSPVKLTLALRLLSDARLLSVTGNDPLTICLPQTEGKVDLTSLPLYRFLHSLPLPKSCENQKEDT